MKLLALIFLFVLLTRAGIESSLDAVREVGIGAGLNLLVILIGCALFLMGRLRIPSLLIVVWAAFLAVCALFSLKSPILSQSIRLLLWYVTYCSASIIPYYILKTERDRNAMINVVILSSLAPAVVGFAQLAGGSNDEEFRVLSTFTHPNIFAFYIVVILAAILLRINLFQKRQMVWRLALGAYALALAVLLTYTKTRAAWMGALLLLVSYLVFLDRRKLPILAVVPLAAYFVPAIQQRLLDATEAAEYIGSGVVLNSYDWRKALWDQAFQWIARDPFFGQGGLGTFYHYSGEFFRYLPFMADGVYAHSVYVELFFEVGILGPTLFAALLAAHAAIFLQAIRYDKLHATIGATLCVVYAIVAYSDNMLDYLTFNWYFWFLIGTLGAWTEVVRKGYYRRGPSSSPRSRPSSSSNPGRLLHPAKAPVSGWSASSR